MEPFHFTSQVSEKFVTVSFCLCFCASVECSYQPWVTLLFVVSVKNAWLNCDLIFCIFFYQTTLHCCSHFQQDQPAAGFGCFISCECCELDFRPVDIRCHYFLVLLLLLLLSLLLNHGNVHLASCLALVLCVCVFFLGYCLVI